MTSTRILAPLSLALAVVLFAVTFPWRDIWVVGLLHAFSEASMIGALADWFAVVALFRHPFGLRIPHTAIIPKHRAKLTNGIIDMVQNSWLNKEAIRIRIDGWDIGGRMLTAAGEEHTRNTLMQMLRRALRDILESMDVDGLVRSIADALRTRVYEGDIMRWLQSGGQTAVERGWHDTLFRHGLEGAHRWLASPDVQKLVVVNLEKIAEEYADSPTRRLGKWVAESVNALNYYDLASAFIRTLQEELQRISVDSAHPARGDFNSWVQRALADLGADSELRDRAQVLLEELISGDRMDTLLRDSAVKLRQALLQDLERDESSIMGMASAQFDRLLQRLNSDATAREHLDRWIKERLVALVDSNHDEIGRMVQDNLELLDDEQLVSQIEDKVGDDLQFIRLNGAVVGGLVGAALYVITWIIS